MILWSVACSSNMQVGQRYVNLEEELGFWVQLISDMQWLRKCVVVFYHKYIGSAPYYYHQKSTSATAWWWLEFNLRNDSNTPLPLWSLYQHFLERVQRIMKLYARSFDGRLSAIIRSVHGNSSLSPLDRQYRLTVNLWVNLATNIRLFLRSSRYFHFGVFQSIGSQKSTTNNCLWIL